MLDDHMQDMFKPTGAKVDVGKRIIGAQEELALLEGKAY